MLYTKSEASRGLYLTIAKSLKVLKIVLIASLCDTSNKREVFVRGYLKT